MDARHDGARQPGDDPESPAAKAGGTPDQPGTVRFGPDAHVFQISINVSFPFSSIVIPAGRRAGGKFFEIARRSIPAVGKPVQPHVEPEPRARAPKTTAA